MTGVRVDLGGLGVPTIGGELGGGSDPEVYGDIRDLLVSLPHGSPNAATRYVRLDLFTVRHELIRRLVPAPRSVFEFGALYGYFLVTALDAAPSIRRVGWVDDESHTPGSNAMALCNVVAESVMCWSSRSHIPPGLQYDLVQVDAAHSFEECLADLEAAALLEPRWIMVDDWTAHPDVVRATILWLHRQPEGLWELSEHETVNGLGLLTRREGA